MDGLWQRPRGSGTVGGMSDPTNFIDPEDIDQWLVESGHDIDDIDNTLGLNSGGVVMLLRELVRRVKELEARAERTRAAAARGGAQNREAVLAALSARGSGSTARALAGDTGLSVSVVHGHLKGLILDGRAVKLARGKGWVAR